MALYRCAHCNFIAEDAATPVGQQVSCSRCGKAATIYPTVFYVEKLVERYTALWRELESLKKLQTNEPEATPEQNEQPSMPDASRSALPTAQ